MKKHWRNEDGFTLSELLIGIQLFSLISLFAYLGFQIFQMGYVQKMKQLNALREESQLVLMIRQRWNECDRFHQEKKVLIGYRDDIEWIKIDEGNVIISGKSINGYGKYILNQSY